jgi:hypothetical protein
MQIGRPSEVEELRTEILQLLKIKGVKKGMYNCIEKENNLEKLKRWKTFLRDTKYFSDFIRNKE